MAAYAALVSLMHTIQQLINHPRPPISLDEQQVHSLTQNLAFLQDFLERYSSSDEDELESRIAGAAYAAEDVIESHIVDQIHAGCTSHCENISSVDLYQRLQRVIQDMNLIKKEVMEIIQERIMGDHDQQMHRNSTVSASRGAQSSTMVGFDDVLNEVMDKLTGRQCNLQIIPIVGMGGMGKTTLARNIYAHPLVVQHFDILAWVTISQDYSRRVVLQVLYQEIKRSKNDLSYMSENELGEILYKHLWGRRYLIVMDDMWSIESWDEVKSFFPDNNIGSKIMITTRKSNLAFQLNGCHGFQMAFLGEDKSWDLLCKIVFGKEGCPIEFESIGKEIARSCRGLPLSIVVIGGLLTKSNMTREYWEYTLEHLNSLINLEDNEHCLQILRTSYKELPIHLKPCFLYIGVFPEDAEIRVSMLARMWVAEGILKPIVGKSLEEVAEEYIKELIDRNLILVHELRWNGKAKLCKIHDLMRDVCLREAQKQRFLCVLRQQDLNFPQGINNERRICIHENTQEEYSPQILNALESASLTRSLLLIGCRDEQSPSFSSRLLRVYSSVDTHYRDVRDLNSVEAILQQANLRYISIKFGFPCLTRFPSSWSLLWNLQTLKLVIHCPTITTPSDIWKMHQLRLAILGGFVLPDPPCGEDNFVLENLHTLSRIWYFKCSEEVVKRIPNIKTLKLEYSRAKLQKAGFPNLYLNQLGHLQKLESLSLYLCADGISGPEIFRSYLVQNLTFPHTLKKLSLCFTRLYWDDLTTKIGSLPLLQVLKLRIESCIGPEWETVEGQFCSLKFLLIRCCHDLKHWTTDCTHFPRLERLVLEYLENLEEIPSSIGDILTLQSIKLICCSKSAEHSAERIKEEQEDNGNVGLKVHVGGVCTPC